MSQFHAVQTDSVTSPALIQIIVPAFNEAESMPSTLARVPKNVRSLPTRILVVDDASTDGTGRAAEEMGVEVVRHRRNLGQGAAIMTGFLVAIERRSVVTVCLDADGQHDPNDLERLIGPILDGEADFVLGSRFLGINKADNPLRLLGIRFLSILLSIVLFKRITDPTNGFRAIRGDYLPYLRSTERRFNALELIVRSRRMGFRIKEVPVFINERTAGYTKKPRILYFLGLLRAMFLGLVSQSFRSARSGRTPPN